VRTQCLTRKPSTWSASDFAKKAEPRPIIKEGDCWRIPVFSSDGRASMPFPIGAVFSKDNRMSDAEIARQINQFGNGEEKGWTPGIATGDDFTKR
jgi:hypothetical protein